MVFSSSQVSGILIYGQANGEQEGGTYDWCKEEFGTRVMFDLYRMTTSKTIYLWYGERFCCTDLKWWGWINGKIGMGL